MLKRNLIKKSFAVLLAVAMTMGMAACGGSGNPSSPSGSSSDSGSENESPKDEENEAAQSGEADGGTASADDLFGDEVTIRVMVWDRGNAAPGTTTENNTLTQYIKDQVKEKFNINVEYVSVPRSGSDDTLNIMMTGGQAPDIVFTYDQALYYNYASSGALTDLTDAYAKYGADIANFCAEAQPIGEVDGKRFAVMKQRGTANARHTSYIRQDWLDELNMELPTTKEELGEYLYAVKEAGLGIPWAMSGRGDTEKMYLNFVGSYVPLEDERKAYIYNEAYMAVAPEAKEGLKVLNQWYNDGLITQEFPTDTAEDAFLADVSNGKVGFVLDDTTHIWDPTQVLNNAVGHETFVPIMCFDLPDGSYRTPYEFRHAMYVMVPSASSDKAEACMKYLNWMADPAVAVNIRYTPDHETDERGVALDLTEEVRNEKGYPGTPDDLSIMNLNFEWVNDYDLMSEVMYDTRTSDWVTAEWFKNYYKVCNTGKYIFPSYGYISEDEQTYGADVKSRMINFVYTCICCPTDQFESTYESGYKELENAGLKKILDARAAYYDSL
ncbi:MAG: extracellular solute-binding protein [Lachnospiraceae bacterium]|nr:extracellular solute-binding protein [Lachnospiraceae bacterium]